MARSKSPRERAICIERIIELTKQYGRLTVTDASAMLGLHRGTTERYFHRAAEQGGLIRYGRCGLFRDQRATIDFDLQRFGSANKKAGMTADQITAAFPHVAKLETQAGRDLLEAMRSQMIEMAVKLANAESQLRQGVAL